MMRLEVIDYPNWKAAILKTVSRLLGLQGRYIAFIDPGGDVEYTPPPQCQSCEGTGRLLTVVTYTVIDCPVCYGRG